MGSVSVPAREVVYPDGRHELRDVGELAESPLWNEDLAPVPIEKRTWTTYNYAALWIGMAHNIPTYLLASSLIALGMAWYQAVIGAASHSSHDSFIDMRPVTLASLWQSTVVPSRRRF